MLFPEQDAPTLKTWIVKRLETPARTDSDVDADVLADYVLALLRHDGEANDVRQLCETELYDFLKDEAKPFVDDVFQTVTYKSYIPGSRPPPKLPPPPPPPAPTQIASTGPTSLQGPVGGSVLGLPWPYQQQQFQYLPSNPRKRSYNESSIPEMGAVSGPQGMPYYQQGGGRAFKQARRGGGVRGGRGGGRGGAGEVMGHASEADPAMGPMMLPPPPSGALGPDTTTSPTPRSMPPGPPNGASHYDPSAGLSMEAMMQMHQMGMPVSMYGFPPGVMGSWNGNGNGDDSGRRRRRRCRFYEKKGFCTRPNCQFDHGDAQENEDAGPDGHGGMFAMMPPPAVAAAMFQHMMPQLPQQRGEAPTEMQGAHGATKRHRKSGRAPFSADGPVYDKSNSTVVVEGIPDENLNEAAVREFFSQFGPVASISMQAKRKLAVVKFDEWAAANAAYHSPKVIFDNRFVKVFWHREKGSGGGGAGDEKNGGSAAGVEEGEVVEGEEGEMSEMDMEDFLRRQEEAQKRHEEKEQLKQELDRKRQELEQRQRALQARQQEERQRLIAKMAAVATRARQGSESGTPSESGGRGGGDGDGESRAASSSSRSAAAISQTEMIRAQLAALEEEARQLGLDPDSIVGGDALAAPLPSWRGRGRGRGGRYSSYTPRGRGRGGFAARGGLHGSVSSSVALAYAAYSLDNRPRRIALTGADFTAPEHDEALRQYLLGVGDYVALDTTAETTTITFADRRTAEKFYYGLALATDQSDKATGRTVPGVADPVELAWVAGGVVASSGAGTTSDGPSGPLASINGGASNRNTLSGNGAAEKSWQADEQGELDAAMDNGTINGEEDNADGNLDEDVDGTDQQEEEQEQEQEQEQDQDQDQDQDQKHSRHGFPHKQQQMDFDVADEGDWDLQ